MAFVGHKHGSERPYPGQLWKSDSLQAIIVAVGPGAVTYDDLTRGGRATESLDAFLATFRRMKR
jgi:hypothetical protein